MLLVMDTSGPFCSAALFDLKANKLVGEMSENLGRGHAERLMPMLEELLAGAQRNWQDITRLGVVNGPGSFTGLRVGLATARGLALALDVPCNTVTVFDAFNEEFGSEGGLGVVMDARRDQIWTQCFEENGSTEGPQVLAVSDTGAALPDTIKRFAGSAATILAGSLGRDVVVVGDALSPPIAAVARCIANQPPADEKPIALYLRAPDAKPQTPLVAKA